METSDVLGKLLRVTRGLFIQYLHAPRDLHIPLTEEPHESMLRIEKINVLSKIYLK